MVSRAFVSSLCGINAGRDALIIKPSLPSGINALGIDKLEYVNSQLSVKVEKNSLEINAVSELKGKYLYYPADNGDYNVEITLPDGNTEAYKEKTDSDGGIVLEPGDKAVKSISVSKAD
ncbi:MAG: hypothetical protein K6C14_01675 [Eubacterium sp.]|nr:hypothetical protein [Eubacterium sp.]